MISFVRGEVVDVTLSAAVLDVGGIGYRVICTPGTLAGLKLGNEARLSTSFVVREDSMTLYGFASNHERDMFELVQTASGVGPKVAQAMLSVYSPEALREAIASSDHAALMSIPGIGRKSAERIVVELKDRVGVIAGTTTPAGWKPQVHEALVSLGYNAKDADKAIAVVAESATTFDVPVLLREALRTLSKA